MADEMPDKEQQPQDATNNEPDDQEDENHSEKRMPFLEHLEELRWCLIKSISAIVLFAIASWFFREKVIDLLMGLNPDPNAKLHFLRPMDALIVQLKISLSLGLILGLPVIIQQIWSFIAPGLLPHEKKYLPAVIFFTILCFVAGASFAYFLIIPFALDFLAHFAGDDLVATWTIDGFLAFVTQLILGFGVVFEMPMLAFVLSWIGIVDDHFLRKYRAYGITSIFVVAALLTPPEPMTQIMLALPLISLYEVSILVAGMVRKRKEKRAEEEDEDYEN